ncbi:chromate transporter [Comamonas serinivorans]|nr:chromate transporter [Comamonas serinivorans]
MSFSPADWLAMALHFMALSLMAVGGAVSTAPEMHRYIVQQRHWLSGEQFNASIALAQAAPGPNLLFVTLVGWQIGWQAGQQSGLQASAWAAAWPWLLAGLGALTALLSMLLPSAVLTYSATRWLARNQARRSVRAFRSGLAPIVIALLFATAWVLSRAHPEVHQPWRLWLLTVAATVVAWRTRWRLIGLIAVGAVLGALGWV